MRTGASRVITTVTRPGHSFRHLARVTLFAKVALSDTTGWLSRPADWEHNGGSGPQNDKRLARVVFTNTLATAIETGWVQDRSLLSWLPRLALDQDSRRILEDRGRRRDRLAGDLRRDAGHVLAAPEPVIG